MFSRGENYGIQRETFEGLRVTSVCTAIGDGDSALVVRDEVGTRELSSPWFRAAVPSAFNSPQSVHAALQKTLHHFTEEIKGRRDVLITVLTPLRNQDALPEHHLVVLGRAPRYHGDVAFSGIICPSPIPLCPDPSALFLCSFCPIQLAQRFRRPHPMPCGCAQSSCARWSTSGLSEKTRASGRASVRTSSTAQ